MISCKPAILLLLLLVLCCFRCVCSAMLPCFGPRHTLPACLAWLAPLIPWPCRPPSPQVKFKKLEDPAEEGFTLELARGLDYDAVTAALAEKLGLADPDLLRLTPQNIFSQQPQRLPLNYRCNSDLARILCHSNHTTDTLYYEVLDMPLPQLEALKTLKVREPWAPWAGGGEGRGAAFGMGAAA